MAEKTEPVAELKPQFSIDDATPTPWTQARRRLAGAGTYWLATVSIWWSRAKVTDETMLHRVADVYMSKYEWPVTVPDGAFCGEGAPTAGPPPYEVAPTTAFGLATDERFSPTRWRF
jgi:hypothetical protein